ncbi:hypothetical protein VT03_17050 [Planctomyces sp. SH-PL14]|nr:hypothetical protein VT03_17050 [Planctomyces sp. SH-PL14]
MRSPPQRLALQSFKDREIGPYPFVVQSDAVGHTDKIRTTIEGVEQEEDCLRMIAEFVQDLTAAGIGTE